MLPALLICALAAGQSDDLAAQSQRGKELMEAGRFEEAIPVYRKLVQAVPGNPGLILNLALAQHMAGHDREAVPNFEAVLKTEPKSLPALLSLGAARLALNEPQQAVTTLRKAVAAYPDDRNARGMLADALIELGRFAEASEQYRKLTDLSPDDPRAWYGLGKSYESTAANAFERLQKANPQSAYVAALVADTRVQTRQYRSAFFFYKEALKQLPNLHGIHAAMADLYRRTGHADWAAAEEAKERDLPAPDCKTHPAECQFTGGHDLEVVTLSSAAPSPEALFWQAKAANELALQAFFRLGQMPPSIELHRLKAEIARNSRQHMEAIKEWRAAIELAPRDPRLLQELTESLFMAKDYRASLEQASALLKHAPRSPELNFVAGDSLLRLEEPQNAVPYLRAALAARPSLREADASLGLALLRLGKTAEAISHLEKSRDLDDDGSLHYQLARAYQAAGEPEKSRAAMAKYQEIVKRSEETKAQLERETQIGPPN
jgi:tetratricopeptide (TPR) repeat protein